MMAAQGLRSQLLRITTSDLHLGDEMAIWDEIKEGLSKTLTDVESKAQELKDTVHSEFELIRLKSDLEEIRKEEEEVFLDMGQKLYQLLESGENPTPQHFKSQTDYLEGLKLKVENLQTKINDFYSEPEKKEDENPEIVVDPKKNGEA